MQNRVGRDRFSGENSGRGPEKIENHYVTLRVRGHQSYQRYVRSPVMYRLQWQHHDELIKDMWKTVEIPEDWNFARTCPIHKKDVGKECNNYSGMALVNDSKNSGIQ